MTTFSTLASSFRFLNNPSVTDVTTCISDFRSETVTNGSPAWTEPVSQTFKSPVDSVGRFWFVQLVRTAATRLRWIIIDQNNITVCDREVQISGTSSVNYYTGQYHAWIEVVTTGEIASSGILDASPLPQGTYGNYVFGDGFRNNGGANDGAGDTIGKLFMLDNGGSAQRNRMRANGSNINGNLPGLVDAAGNLLYIPCDIMAFNSSLARWSGKPYQLMLHDQSITAGTSKTIIIGSAGETGTFRALSGIARSEQMGWMLRTS